MALFGKKHRSNQEQTQAKGSPLTAREVTGGAELPGIAGYTSIKHRGRDGLPQHFFTFRRPDGRPD